MQTTNNTKMEYLSRKYTLTLIALIAVVIVILFIDKGAHYEWGAVLVAILGQYAWFNVQEAKTLKDLEFKKMDMNGNGSAVAADGTKPPVEG